MKTCFLVVASAFLFAAVPNLPGQDAVAIDAESAVALALRSNLGIEAEGLSLDLKRLAKDTVHNVFYPQIAAGVALSRTNEAPSPVPVPLPGPPPTLGFTTPPHTFGLGTSLSATLPLSLSMIHEIRRVRQDYEAGLLALETARGKLALAVRKSFYNLLVLEERIKLVQQNLAAATTRYNQALANFRSGLVDEYTLLAAQVAMETIRPAIEEARSGYRTALLAFKMDLGLEYDREVRLSGKVEPETYTFDAKSLAARFLQRNPDVRSLVLAGQAAENRIKLQNSYLYPALTLMYSLDPTFSGDPFADSWLDGDWSQRSGMLRIGVSVGLDVFLPDSKARNEIRKAEIDRETVRVRLAQALRGTELEIRRIVMNLEKSEKKIGALELNVRLADKANRMGQEAYNAGLKEYSQIETTELALQEARLNLLREKYNYLAGLLELEYTLNTTLETLHGNQT